MKPELEALAKEIGGCRACAEEFASCPTVHDPQPVLRLSARARICICGQAPGVRVHASGIPFDDPSGDRLRSWMGVSRQEFFDLERFAIVPMAFCFPGQDENGSDLPPPSRCARLWRCRVFAAMPQFELMLLVGYHAQRWHLGCDSAGTLTANVLNWREFLPNKIPLPHPSWRNNAWLDRNPWFQFEVVPELQRRIGEVFDAESGT